MERFRQLFKWAEDPRTSNATRHDFVEMLLIALFSSLAIQTPPIPLLRPHVPRGPADVY